jgi:hypothetical protein
MAGIAVRGEQPGQVHAAVSVKGETNVVIAVVLCVLCLIPGLIYLAVTSGVKTEPAVVHLAPAAPGTTAVTVQASPGVRQAILGALGSLPW